MAFERRILTNYDASTAGFDRGTRRVESQLARLQRTTDNRLRAIDDRFARAGRAALRLGTAIGAIGAGLGVNAVRRYAEAWRNAERQLTAAGAAVEGNREKLARLAIRTRGDFQAVSGAVARFARVTGDGLDDSIRRVETLNKLLAVGGASGGERASATLQLTQGLRSGQLGGEELRAIREAAPIEFLDALAARAGGTRAELKQLGADAKLTSDVIKGALDDLAETADRQFAQLALTGEEAVDTLSTGFSVFFGRLDEQFGATAGFNQFLQETGQFLAEDAEAAATFAKSLEVAAVAAGTLAGGRALQAVNRALVEGGVARREAVRQSQALVAATTAEVQKQRELVVARGQAFATAQRTATSAAQLERAKRSLVLANNNLIAAEGRAAAATRALTIAQGNLSAATRITARAMSVLRGAFNFFGGVPGLILGAVSAAVLLTDAFEDQADRLNDLQGKLADVASGISRVRQAEQDLERDTEALKVANERLETAIANQADAAADTARLEIDAINRRIGKNRELKAEYEALIQAQIGVIQGQLSIERRQFQREFGGTGATFQRPVGGAGASAAGPGEFGTIAPRGEDLALQQTEAIARQEEEINRKLAERQTLSKEELKFLETRRDLKQLEIDLETQLQNLTDVRNPREVETPTGGAEDLGGGSGKKSKEEKDALEELIDAADQRAFQLLDEIQLTRAAAEEVAFLEEKQRLLNAAHEAELAITPELMGTIDGLAQSYAAISNELDDLRAAKQVITQVTEAELTTAEKIERAHERLEALLPAIIALVEDEAEAYRILAAAKEDVADKIREADEDENLKELGDGLANAISQANSLEDALEGVLRKLAEIALQDAFLSLFTGGNTPSGEGGPLSGFFDDIFSGVFHGGRGPGEAGPQRRVPAAAFLDAPRFHSGRFPGFGPGESPAIIRDDETIFTPGQLAALGEIVVPKNIGTGSGGNSVTVEGSTIVLQGSNATPEEVQRLLDQRDRRLIERIVEMNDRDPDIFHT